MQNVTAPRDVIDFLRKKENKSVFGMGREITFHFYNKSRPGCCVQLRQFFRSLGNDFTLHYEIEEYDGGLGVEIHSEKYTPRDVHDFIRTQFLNADLKDRTKTAYRFAVHWIDWQGRELDEVIEDIKVAVDDLYRKYDAYLNYVEGYYAGKGSVEGCKSYKEFMHKVTALKGELGT